MAGVQCKPLPVITEALVRKFNARIDKRGPAECWLWTGVRFKSGYGQFYFAGSYWTASRIAFGLAHGDPGQQLVLHQCDNPACQNAAHLFLGTHRDNTADMVAKGRARYGAARGSAHGQSKLTEDDVRAILASTLTAAKLAVIYRVSGHTISMIRTGNAWKHVRAASTH